MYFCQLRAAAESVFLVFLALGVDLGGRWVQMLSFLLAICFVLPKLMMSLRRISHINCNEITFPPVSVLMAGDNIGAMHQILIFRCLIPMGGR